VPLGVSGYWTDHRLQVLYHIWSLTRRRFPRASRYFHLASLLPPVSLYLSIDIRAPLSLTPICSLGGPCDPRLAGSSRPFVLHWRPASAANHGAYSQASRLFLQRAEPGCKELHIPCIYRVHPHIEFHFNRRSTKAARSRDIKSLRTSQVLAATERTTDNGQRTTANGVCGHVSQAGTMLIGSFGI
jgi:hypothetical protein